MTENLDIGLKNTCPWWLVNKPYLNIWCGCCEEKICLVESFWIMKLFRFLDGWMSWTSQGRFSVVIEWSSFFGNHVSHQQQIYTFTCIWSHQDMCHSIMKKWKYVMENNWNYWRPKANDKFDSVWSNHLDKTQHTLAMEQNLENYDFGLKDANVTILKKTTGNVIKSNKCNQCDYASMHSGEKSNKCN